MYPLIAALGNGGWDVRLPAAYALAMIADPEAIEPLRRLLDDSDESVRDAAACALEAIEQKSR